MHLEKFYFTIAHKRHVDIESLMGTFAYTFELTKITKDHNLFISPKIHLQLHHVINVKCIILNFKVLHKKFNFVT
jgi:hypothetical protein